MMLSLPEDWNYTTRGLAAICKEGVGAIGKALKELESAGYIIRYQRRDARGRIADTEYIIYEQPHQTTESSTAPPDTENPDMEKEYPDTSSLEQPDMEKAAEINTNKIKKDQAMIDQANTHSVSLIDDRKIQNQREKIRLQIEYKCIHPHQIRQVDEIIDIMLEVYFCRSPTIKIGRNAEYPTALVQQRFSQLTFDHIEKVLNGIKESAALVRNTKAYLLAALFNVTASLDNHFTMLVNHDIHGI